MKNAHNITQPIMQQKIKNFNIGLMVMSKEIFLEQNSFHIQFLVGEHNIHKSMFFNAVELIQKPDSSRVASHD